MLTEEEKLKQGPVFNKLIALSLCTHQLNHIINTTQQDLQYHEVNKKACSIAEKRILQVKLSELQIQNALDHDTLRLTCNFVCKVMVLA